MFPISFDSSRISNYPLQPATAFELPFLLSCMLQYPRQYPLRYIPRFPHIPFPPGDGWTFKESYSYFCTYLSHSKCSLRDCLCAPTSTNTSLAPFATWESGYFLFDTSVSTTRSRLAFIVVVIPFGLYPTSSLKVKNYTYLDFLIPAKPRSMSPGLRITTGNNKI